MHLLGKPLSCSRFSPLPGQYSVLYINKYILEQCFSNTEGDLWLNFKKYQLRQSKIYYFSTERVLRNFKNTAYIKEHKINDKTYGTSFFFFLKEHLLAENKNLEDLIP